MDANMADYVGNHKKKTILSDNFLSKTLWFCFDLPSAMPLNSTVN